VYALGEIVLQQQMKRSPPLSLVHQVSPQEMVQEIHQVLMDREDTCHRTCFSLQLDGNVLDNFAELKSIEGLQEGSLLKVVEGENHENERQKPHHAALTRKQ